MICTPVKSASRFGHPRFDFRCFSQSSGWLFFLDASFQRKSGRIDAQEREQEFITPSSLFDLLAHAAFVFRAFDYIESQSPECGEVLRSMPLAGAALVLFEDHIEKPVGVVFHSPVLTAGFGECLNIERQARKIVPPLGADHTVDVADRLDRSEACKV